MDAPIENMISGFGLEITKENKNSNDYNRLLRLFDDNQILNIQKINSLQEIISYVHGCLNTSKCRGDGFLILDKLVSQSVTEVFVQHAVTWIRFIIQSIESHDPPAVKSLACHVGCQIIPLTVSFTALAKDVINSLPQLIQGLLSRNSEWERTALKLLGVCVQSYPGPCITLKGKIEAAVLVLLQDEKPPQEAIRLYINLAQCGGGGNKGIKHTEAWSQKCHQILTSITNVVHLLYEGIYSADSSTKYSADPLPMKDLPEEYTTRYGILSSYLHTYILCLRKLLSQPFPAPVKVPVTDIIDIVSTILSVNSKDLVSRPSTERLVLSGYIPAIHTDAINCLHTLISRCRTLLLPQAKAIVSLLVKELLWSQVKIAYGQTRAYSALRQSVYRAITEWLKTTQCLTVSTEEDVWLIQEILHDGAPHTDDMKVDSKIDKKSSNFEPPPAKKKKRGGYSELTHGISSQRKINTEADSDLCCSALETLYCVISYLGSQMKLKVIEDIQNFVLSVALTFRRPGNYGIPYTDDRCRLIVLKVMKSLNLMPHPTAPSILQYSLSIFRSSSQDTSSMVSTFSLEALQVCEALVHARAPCFQMPKLVPREKPTNGSTDNNFNANAEKSFSSVQFSDHSLDPRQEFGSDVIDLDNLRSTDKNSSRKTKANEDVKITKNYAENKKRSNDAQHSKPSTSKKADSVIEVSDSSDSDIEIDPYESKPVKKPVASKQTESGKAKHSEVVENKSSKKTDSVHVDDEDESIDLTATMDTDQNSGDGDSCVEGKETSEKEADKMLSNEDQMDMEEMMCAFVDADTDQ